MKPLFYVEESDTVRTEIYYLMGEYTEIADGRTIADYPWHREDGPAYVVYWDKKLFREVWWNNGLRHRLNGQPADIRHDKNIVEWYIDGASLPFNDVKKWFDDNGIAHPDYMTPNEQILFNLRFSRR